MGIVGRVIHVAGILRGRASRALKPFDLHYTDLDVLATLRRSGAPYTLTPTDLTRSVLLSSGAMTAALRRLAKRGGGLVERAPGKEDGRVRTVALTVSGKSLIDEAIVVRFDEATSAVHALSAEEQRQLASLLRRLALSLT